MRYLGRLHGHGVVSAGGRDIARASYDIDGFAVGPHVVIGSGEIRSSAAALGRAFGRRGIRLRTDDGRLLDLRFSEKTLREDSVAAHVDVAGDLPQSAEGWHAAIASPAAPAPAGSAPPPRRERRDASAARAFEADLAPQI